MSRFPWRWHLLGGVWPPASLRPQGPLWLHADPHHTLTSTLMPLAECRHPREGLTVATGSQIAPAGGRGGQPVSQEATKPQPDLGPCALPSQAGRVLGRGDERLRIRAGSTQGDI